MGNTQKPKKLRKPNVPMMGVSLASPRASPAPAAPAARARVSSALALRTSPRAAAPVEFDYTYIRQDLRRIGILAGSFIVILVGLSFFIR